MFNKRLKNIKPYIAGEQLAGEFIKLNTNENAYSPSKKVTEALKDFSADTLRLYPDPKSKELVAAIAKHEGVDEGNIFVGNGSDEVLAFCLASLFDKSVAFSDITYSFYPVYADFFSLKAEIVPLKEDFRLDFTALIKAKAGGRVICNPNAPTGIIENGEDILKVCDSTKEVLLIDEAYIDFADTPSSLASSVISRENLCVVKTFSKSYSLAGMRCGYAVASKNIIAQLTKAKDCFNSYPVNRVTTKVITAALEDKEYFSECIEKIKKTRTEVITELKKMGAEVLPSQANFVLMKYMQFSAEQVYLHLKNKDILVRHWKNKHRITNYTRVTIGTAEQMQKFIKCLHEL